MDDLVERLRNLDTCVVSDALDLHELPGVVSAIGPLTGVTAVAGRAVTVDLVPAGSAADGRAPRHLATAAIASSGVGDVIVVAHPGVDCAGWGGLLSQAAQAQHIEGTVVGGPIRDVDESRSRGYPVFGHGVTPRTARGRLVEASWGERVRIDGVAVDAGDLVLADGSGVVFVASAVATRVIADAERLAERERRLADAIHAGRTVTDVMGTAYERFERGEE